MRRVLYSLFISILWLGLLAADAAPGRAEYPHAGLIYLSFSPSSRVAKMDINPGERFDFYLVVDLRDSGDPMSAYEVNVKLDPRILLGTMLYTPAGSINVGGGFANGQMDLVVGTGDCVLPPNTPLAVVTFEGLLLEDAENVFISLDAVSRNSSVDGEGPAWASCGTYTLRVFDVPAGRLGKHLLINGVPLTAETSSWGAVKALYDR